MVNLVRSCSTSVARTELSSDCTRRDISNPSIGQISTPARPHGRAPRTQAPRRPPTARRPSLWPSIEFPRLPRACSPPHRSMARAAASDGSDKRFMAKRKRRYPQGQPVRRTRRTVARTVRPRSARLRSTGEPPLQPSSRLMQSAPTACRASRTKAATACPAISASTPRHLHALTELRHRVGLRQYAPRIERR